MKHLINTKHFIKEISEQFTETPSIEDTLRILKNKHKNRIPNVYQRLHKGVSDSLPFYKTLLSENIVKDPVMLTMLHIAENSGRIGPALNLLEEFHNWNEFLNKRIKALVFSNLMVFTIFVSLILLFFITLYPFILDFYTRFNIQMSCGGLGRLIFRTGQFVNKNLMISILTAFFSIYATYKAVCFFISYVFSPVKKLRAVKKLNILYGLKPDITTIETLKKMLISLKNENTHPVLNHPGLENDLKVLSQISEHKSAPLMNILNQYQNKQAKTVDISIKRINGLFNVLLFFLIISTFLALIHCLSMPILNIFGLI